MTRSLTKLELEVITFALECEGNLVNVRLPSPADKVIEEYEGFVRFAEAPNGSRKVGSAAFLSNDDHVVIDVFCNSDAKACAFAYVSMNGIDPPRFPQSVAELSCDVSFF